MKNKGLFIGCVCLSAALILSGCKEAKKDTASNSSMEKGEISYPLKDVSGETIKFWKPLNGGVSSVAPSENEIQFTKWLYEDTGINVEYVHPPASQENEKFNLMLASGELPDILNYTLSNSSDGAEKLVKNGYIEPLTEEFLKNYAPNFYRELSNDKELARSAKLNDGTLYGFSNWRGSDNMTVYTGPMIRKDWLDKLKLPMPETIEDWHNVLSQFKNELGATAPLTLRGTSFAENGFLSGAFGTKLNFYTENGKVTHGILDPEFKKFVETMSLWYSEGLIDSDFSSNSKEQADTKMLTGKSGATYGIIGSVMGNLLAAAPDDKYTLVAAKYPSIEKGGISEFGAKDSRYYEPCYLIAATSENKELAARFLDYGYSEKGHMLYNFGRENESYKMVDGFPTFTDLINKNPDGLSRTQALNMYTHCAYMGPQEFDERFFKQQYEYESQREAIDVWGNTNAKEHMLVIYNGETSEEKSEEARLMVDINNNIKENVVKFIMGIQPMSGYDSFVENLKTMGIEKVIDIKQKAYDRYEAR